MKKFKVALMIAFTIFLYTSTVYAACTTVTYYSRKDWVSKQDFIDTSFNADDSNFIQSDDILVHMNILGTHSHPMLQSSSVVLGTETYEINGNINPSDYPYFQIDMGKEIKVNQLEFDIRSFNSDGTAKELIVYANATMEWINGVATITDGEEIYRSMSNNRIILDLDSKEISNLFIVFTDIHSDDRMIFSYFQINEYEVYEHVEWTTEYIANTEKRMETICLNSGEYVPNGTQEKWMKSANTIFTPSASIISNYIPELSSQNASYDYGRGGNIPAYSLPNVVKNMGGYATQIKGWTTESLNNGEYTNAYKSYGSEGTVWPWIMTGQQTGVQYIAYPVYWSQTQGLNNYLWADSWDSGWCEHTTGSTKTPCYKYGGHSSNGRLNSYDVMIQTYKNVVKEADRIVVESNYYLVNTDTKQTTWLKKGAEEIQEFLLNQSGRWQIKAVLKDAVGNTGEKLSDIFLIDNTAPVATFTPYSQEEPTTENLEVIIRPSDGHSGVMQWRYSVSSDGGLTFNSYSDFISGSADYKVILNQSGDYLIKAEVIDNAGNSSVSVSGHYLVQKSDPEVGRMYTAVFIPNEPQELHIQLACTNCKVDQKATLQVFCEDTLIHEKEVEIGKKQEEVLKYTSPNEQARLLVNLVTDQDSNLDNNRLELIVPKISAEKKETMENQLQFEGVTVSMVQQNDSQKDYKEYLTLSLNQDKQSYFAGEGIEMNVDIQYINECASVVDFACKSDSVLSFDKQTVLFDQGASPAKNHFEVDEGYRVPLSYRGTQFILPNFFAGKHTGNIVIDPDDIKDEEIIDAGRKWYTDIRSEKKEYFYEIRGINSAVNRFNWKFKGNYTVDSQLKDQYRIRFVDPENVFPNGKSKAWKELESWFDALNFNSNIQCFEIEEMK